MLKILGIVVGVSLASVALMMLYGATLPATTTNKPSHEACDKMMADSRPGFDRQTTRQVCERLGWRG